MGRSVGLQTDLAEGRIIHKLSGSTITIRRRGDALEHQLERDGVTAKYPVAYSVGAGVVGYSFMVRVGRYLFQSPASYYTQTKSWDLTPGYETERSPDFTHPISSGCLLPHRFRESRRGRRESVRRPALYGDFLRKVSWPGGRAPQESDCGHHHKSGQAGARPARQRAASNAIWREAIGC